MIERLDLKEKNLIQQGVIGFCGYHLIKSNGDGFRTSIEENILSVSLESLREASILPNVSVIGVGFGVKKAPVIKAALRRGYINSLFVDESLAIELLKGS